MIVRFRISVTSNRRGCLPILTSDLGDVFMPIAVIAVTRHQRDNWLPALAAAADGLRTIDRRTERLGNAHDARHGKIRRRPARARHGASAFTAASMRSTIT
jgi:hypothetical protein